MALSMVGQRIAHYEILGELGAGGMGVVYRARDQRLGRQVAVKILPEELTGDEERLARFRREAQILAKLSHSNIGAIYGLERVGGRTYLILELVEGQTLADAIAGRALGLGRTLHIASGIAKALEASHRALIVHRDLKPGNVMLDAESNVKVLDFGLAKSVSPEQPTSTEISESPTLVAEDTEEGAVLGTAPYMSPEQVRGQPVDARTDIWAFGCVLFEMLTGKRAFGGPTSSDIRAAVLRETPAWEALPQETPDDLRRLLRWCLARELAERLRSIGDARLILDDCIRDAERPGPRAIPSRPARPRWLAPAAALGLLAVGLLSGSALMRLAGRRPEPPMHIAMAPPPGVKPGLGHGPSVAISPRGGTIALVLESGRSTRLYIKRREDREPRPLAGTEGARTPFFSPRGEWIAFFDEDDRKLKKISLGGGEPVEITGADGQWGLSWVDDDTILAASTTGGLVRVSPQTGHRRTLTAATEMIHFWPEPLPDGKTVLFTILPERGSFEEASIAAVPLSGGEPKIVLESAYYPQYAPTGHLIFVQRGAVVAAPFDLRSLKVTGAATTVLEGVWTSSWTGYAEFAFSDDGTLVYISGGPDPTRAILVSVDRAGVAAPLVRERRPYRLPRLSPDGTRVALTLVDEQVDVWTYDLARGSLDRLTDSASWDAYPSWQPGLEWVAFSSMRKGQPAVYRQSLRTGAVERVTAGPHPTYPSSWSPDGRLLAYSEDHPETGFDIWIHDLGSGADEPFLRSAYNESGAEFSPDGRWIAYESNETGRHTEVYIRPYPEGSPRTQVSTDGGETPRWAPTGREIFYVAGGELLAVDVATAPALRVGPPRRLFAGPYGTAYDVARDGRSFVMLMEMAESDPPLRINLTTNWFDELERLAPPAG